MDIRYLRPVETESDPKYNGWLTGIFTRNTQMFQNDKVELVEYTKVEYHGSFKDQYRGNAIRDSVTPLEGLHKGKQLSVPRSNGSSLFLKAEGNVYNAPATLFYHNTKNQVWFTGGPVVSTDEPDFAMGKGRGTNPGQNSWLPPGDYNIRIPEYPSGYGASYVGKAKNPMVWFPIANGGGNTMTDRFLHPGQVSYGCVSVSVKEDFGVAWAKIYDYLIRSRLSDKSVGTLRVYGSITED